jgi:hypothetical protein
MTDEQFKELMAKLDLTIDTKLSGLEGIPMHHLAN